MENDRGTDRNSKEKVAPVLRIRVGEIYSALSVPVLVAGIGLLWNYTHTNQADLDRKISQLRTELYQQTRDVKADLVRYVDSISDCCKRRRR